MKRYAICKLVLCVSFLLLLFIPVTNASAANKYPIDYVIQHGSDLVKETITVSGVVSNSQTATPDPTDEVAIKGEFDLTDKTGVIHIKTTDDPPANGIKLTVKGTVDASSYPPMIVHNGGIIGDSPLPLYIALAVLIVLAIVLVVMLTRKPQPKMQPVSVGPAVRTVPQGVQGPPPVKPGINCPNCGFRNDPDAKHCEECGKPLKGGTIPPPTPTAQPRIEEKGTIPPTSSAPAIADLTVVETGGNQLNARFELSKDGKGLKIGRDAKMGIQIDDETVSKEHARIWWSEEDKAFYIQDENSTWGTAVNGQKISRVALNDNDQITLGKTKLVFRLIGAQMPGDRTVPPPSA